jgi:hypothetical protein
MDAGDPSPSLPIFMALHPSNRTASASRPGDD